MLFNSYNYNIGADCVCGPLATLLALLTVVLMRYINLHLPFTITHQATFDASAEAARSWVGSIKGDPY